MNKNIDYWKNDSDLDIGSDLEEKSVISEDLDIDEMNTYYAKYRHTISPKTRMYKNMYPSTSNVNQTNTRAINARSFHSNPHTDTVHKFPSYKNCPYQPKDYNHKSIRIKKCGVPVIPSHYNTITLKKQESTRKRIARLIRIKQRY